MGIKDVTLAGVVDEIIQLWTNMWVADAEHDNAIADNVQGMQRRCEEILRRLLWELLRLRSDLKLQTGGGGGRKKLGAAAAPPPVETVPKYGFPLLQH